MASNIRFIFKNLADSAVISASPAFASTAWITNLQKRGRLEARSASNADQDINLVWTANQRANAIVLPRNNLTDAGTARGRLYDDAPMSSLISGADTGVLDAFNAAALKSPDDIADLDFRGYKNTRLTFGATYTTVRGAKLTLSDAANPDGFKSASRIVVGEWFETRYNMPYGGLTMSPQSLTVRGRVDGGGAWADKKADFRRFVLNLNWIPPEDLPYVLAGLRYVGTHRDFYISLAYGIGGIEEIYYQGLVHCAKPVDFNHHNVDLVGAPVEMEEE